MIDDCEALLLDYEGYCLVMLLHPLAVSPQYSLPGEVMKVRMCM